MRDLITLCLTIGRRPDLLRQTLESLGSLRDLPVLAINDFGDAETNAMFHQLCPHGRIVGPGHRLGHHPAVDVLYQQVTTPFIFHCEDDWAFTRTDFLPDALRLLNDGSEIVQVCFRDTGDMPLSDADRALIVTETRAGIGFQRLDGLHQQWHGYTLNPHLIRRDEWQRLGGFSGFAKERHISRHMRGQGRFAAFLLPPACHHIGEDRGVEPPKKTIFKSIKNWLRGRA
ncbi:MAG: hypothetical protein Q4G24_05565 [Paracoccus sp. (in: a-proteobacteria)]|uniref:hypothetical protein n=1 Tax=Paracoccus sp. TaxID=267 RepID=UPI0026E0D61C|nr:hypothetical protein [Paracoccus sp. (in: a-proteobacteria)]MDO5620921.1 hypothetical protein [Paracoccus sp. (in: a-proteobacteria)]